jgi:kynureninase
VWCTYKYLNSGAGGIGGAFVHSRHHESMPSHLEGWWSNKQETRFEMREQVDAAAGAESFRLCNPPPWLAALNLASLEIFREAGLPAVLAKQRLLTGYLEALLLARLPGRCRIITPASAEERGSQLSLVFTCDLNRVHKRIERRGVVCDVRLPSAMRIAPAPLYNSFMDVLTFVTVLQEALDHCEE